MHLAHIEPNSRREQTVKDHLIGTAELAKGFASQFGAGEAAYRCGLLHDIGKFSAAFQRRIQTGTGRTDHSTAGAQEALKLRDYPAAFCIAGHHGGLPDMGTKADTSQSTTLSGRLKKKVEDYGAFKDEIEVISGDITPTDFLKNNWNAYFYTKMLYSCLVDADYLDTERFMQTGIVERGNFENLSAYAAKLEKYIEPWWNATSELNQVRCDILKTLRSKGKSERGVFSLTVPTGGGKTISSMAFALKHAEAHELKRIIYVIPYTSIIDQTADVFESVFGSGSIVAHHANAEFDNDAASSARSKNYLATENWDAPVILTTAVQFFESLYSDRPSRCRKLHNISNSVIIFDEAQMLPVPYLNACVCSISQLVKLYGCSAVLCTATQPALAPIFKAYLPDTEIEELCPSELTANPNFKRVTYVHEGYLEDEDLAKRLNEEKQVLCIVNSRKQAQSLYRMMQSEGTFHLSTMMYPEHRRETIKQIRSRLTEGLPCRVISTSLIEAGVDVDFPTVYRAISGLDSIIQAAGRCNREGKRPADASILHIFDSEQRAPDTLQQNIYAAQHTMGEFEDLSSAEAVHEYFRFLLYTLKGEEARDTHFVCGAIERGSMAFRSIGEHFRLIEGCGYTVYVPIGKGKQLCDTVIDSGPSRTLLRRLGNYSVGVYENQYRQLLEDGAIEPIADNAGILRDIMLYNPDTGLCFGADEGRGIFI